MAGIKQIKSTPRKPRKLALNQDDWLNDLLDDYLTGVMNPSTPGVFHPSSLSNLCDRFVWLTYHGYMPSSVLEPTVQRIFQNGNYLEKRVETWFSKLGILVARELPVKFETPSISGRIDFLIKHEDGIIPIELKSINTAGFGKLQAPKPEHEMQLQMYLNMGNYSRGTVLYENKNDQRLSHLLYNEMKKHGIISYNVVLIYRI